MNELYQNNRQAYYRARAQLNAKHRYEYALAICLAAAVFLGSYLYAGVFDLTLEASGRGARSAPFLWLLITGIIGRAMGSKSLDRKGEFGARLEACWVGAVIIGAVWLAYHDAHIGDVSGYAVLMMPISILMSTGRVQVTGLFLAPCLVVLTLTLLFVPASVDRLMFMVTIVAITGAAIYIARNMENTRKTDFLAQTAVREKSRDLNTLNMQLGHRQRQLAFSNSQLKLRSEELEAANAALKVRGEELSALNQQLVKLAMTDSLTGVANRRRLMEIIENELARTLRYNTPCALAMIDIDHFGRFNKDHGVLTGDAVLTEFARLLKAKLRSVDTVGRYGGEEFVLVMPGSDELGAKQLVERIRQQTAVQGFTNRRLPVTFSAGITDFRIGSDSAEHALTRADAAMRRAKSSGRNQVMCA